MTSRLVSAAALAPSLVLLLAADRADAQPAIASADPIHAPGFSLLDRMDGTSRAGLDMAYLVLDDGLDGTVMRFDAHAQYISQASRFGGYFQLPLAMATGEGDDVSALGNLELGGIYLPRLGSESFGLVLRAGVTLPTGATGIDAIANILTSVVRPGDIYNTLPKGTSLRFAASPMLRSGSLFGRLDLGVDVNLDADGDERFDNVFRLQLGVGAQLGPAALTAELSNVFIFAEMAEDLGEQALNVASLSVRGARGRIRPYGGLVLPLDDDSTEVIDAALLIGVDATID